MLELAREADWEAVRELSVQVHDLHAQWRPDIYFHCEEPYPKEQFLKDIQNRMVYVAKVQNLVAGYVVLATAQKGGPGIVPKKFLLINSICVDKAVQGQGIGKEMMADIRALGKVFRCDEIMLSVHPENDSAVGFYQKCGFCIRSIHMDCKL